MFFAIIYIYTGVYYLYNKYAISEIEDYARVIGIEDVHRESELLWIAKEGINAPLPENWKPWYTVSHLSCEVVRINLSGNDELLRKSLQKTMSAIWW